MRSLKRQALTPVKSPLKWMYYLRGEYGTLQAKQHRFQNSLMKTRERYDTLNVLNGIIESVSALTDLQLSMRMTHIR